VTESRDSAFGMNVYFWGRREQDRLLRCCISPILLRLRRHGHLRSFWYDRSDRRSPHIHVLIGTNGPLEPVRESTLDTIKEYIAREPSVRLLSHDELADLHADADGKCLCSLDQGEDVIPNNTVLACIHGRKDEPFSTVGKAPDVATVLDILTEISILSLESLSPSFPLTNARAAVTCMLLSAAAFDATDAAEYWRFHVNTLIKGLDASHFDGDLLKALPDKALGQASVRALTHYHRSIRSGRAPMLPAQMVNMSHVATPEKLRSAFRNSPSQRIRNEPEALAVYRLMFHVLFKQLGITTQMQIPIAVLLWLLSSQHAETPV